MTGTITGTKSTGFGGKLYILSWKCDASGDGAVWLNADLALGLITGTLEFIETAPGENGDLTTDLPTASYDVYLKDAYGFDWAEAGVDDRSGTVAEKYVPTTPPMLIGQDMQLVIDNAGDAKRGRVLIGVKSL